MYVCMNITQCSSTIIYLFLLSLFGELHHTVTVINSEMHLVATHLQTTYT